ncbi:MAG: trypsin-like serine protease, partial [Deltaproteobacteria bacterium]
DFVIGPAPAMSCDGDSGGAVFVTAGSVEEVAGITSFGDARCMESGTNTRVDAYRTDFIDPDTAAAGATPPTRPAFDPGTDYCMDACTSDADCPVGMGCTPNPAGGTSCGFRGLPPGRFGAACVAGGSCESGMCLAEGAGCLCYTPCTAPPGDDGGCGCTTSPGSATPVWTLVIACGLFVKRRRARAITRSAQGPPSCRTRRASWRHDRHPHGGDDNIFPHPECELVQSCCADDITTPAPDRIRSGLRERGIELLDIADGVRWKRS